MPILNVTLCESQMEITTTIEKASTKLKALNMPAETMVHIIIEEKQPPESKRDDFYERMMNFEPIEVGEKDIVETIREEREKLDTRNVGTRHG